MTSVELLDSCLAMLRQHGLRPTDISVVAGELKITGLALIPPTPQEEALEASSSRRADERLAENKRILGLE
jgi:hypothetical protein